MTKLVKNFFGKKEEGATMVEYAIMVALIALVACATVFAIGDEVNRLYGKLVNAL